MNCCGNHEHKQEHNPEYKIQNNEEKKSSWFWAAIVIFIILMLLISLVI